MPGAFRAACAILIAMPGCGDDGPAKSAATSGGVPDGGPPAGCSPGEVTEPDGSCRPAGVPPDRCAPGFDADGNGGCVAVLPAEPCGPGTMALPGETSCREVAPCGDPPFGGAPDAPTTQHVDAAYGGTDSDGSEARPWTTIQDGIDAAASGAVVAVAGGTYGPFVVDSAITVAGRCPSLVEVIGVASTPAVLMQAVGAKVSGLGIHGAGFGLVSFSKGAAADHVWVHDTALVGVYVDKHAEIQLTESLVEETGEVGVGAKGGGVALDRVEVRRVHANGAKALGLGVTVQADGATAPSLTILSSFVDANLEHGVLATGTVSIEATLIRGTLPRLSDDTFGRGLAVISDPTSGDATLVLRSSVLDQNHEDAIFIGAADATIEATVVRGTQPLPDGTAGRGVEAQWLPTTGRRASVEMRDSLVEGNHYMGIVVLSSDATLDGVVIRATDADPSTGEGRGLAADAAEGGQPTHVAMTQSVIEQSRTAAVLSLGSDIQLDRTAIRDNGAGVQPLHPGGVAFQDQDTTGLRATGTITSCLVERNTGIGINVLGSDVTVDGTQVLDTRPDSTGEFGRGIQVGNRPETGQPGHLVIRDTTIRQSRQAGVVVVDADAELERVTIAETSAGDTEPLGDGLAVVSLDVRSTVTVTASRIEGSARAGVGNFGSDVSIAGSVFECNEIHLDGEDYDLGASSYADQGGNVCGCAGASVECKVLSSDLAPPTAAGP